MDDKQKLEGRNISFDQSYTSFRLATWLLNKKHVTCIGTLMANWKGIPPDVNKIHHREIQSTEFYWDKEHDLVLESYVVISSTKEKRNVILLSTHKPILGTTIDDDKNKAALYMLYDFTKGGTDIVDQRMGFYTCRFKSHKWSIVTFSYIVDMVRVNSSTLFSLNENKHLLKQSSFEFGMNTVCSLAGPFIEPRNQSHLAPSIKRKISVVLDMMQLPNPATAPSNRADVGNFPSKSEKRSTCFMCIEQLKTNRNQKSISGIKLLCQARGH